MLMPKKVKYRKQQRGRMTGKAWRGSTLAFGQFGLKVLEPGWITDRQIEASRVAMTRFRQARRKDLDPFVSGQACHEEAGRNPYGQGQGRSRSLGRGGKVRGRFLFEMEGVTISRRERGDAPRLAQASAADDVCEARSVLGGGDASGGKQILRFAQDGKCMGRGL